MRGLFVSFPLQRHDIDGLVNVKKPIFLEIVPFFFKKKKGYEKKHAGVLLEFWFMHELINAPCSFRPSLAHAFTGTLIHVFFPSFST